MISYFKNFIKKPSGQLLIEAIFFIHILIMLLFLFEHILESIEKNKKSEKPQACRTHETNR
jgi:hypothetical protein